MTNRFASAKNITQYSSSAVERASNASPSADDQFLRRVHRRKRAAATPREFPDAGAEEHDPDRDQE
jgi:hypothetical protein